MEAPCCPGVYFLTTVINGIEVPYYIGSSKSLRSRLSGHSVWRQMQKEMILASVYFIPMRDTEYKQSEIYYIRWFKPFLNKTHKKDFFEEYIVNGVKIRQVDVNSFIVI